MATLLLTGPQKAGKTTIFRIVQEKPIPKGLGSGTPATVTETAHRLVVRGPFLGIPLWYSSDNVRDTSGSSELTLNQEQMEELIKEDSFIGYVFDVAKFWKELDDSCKQGGETTAAIRFFWNIWNGKDEYRGKALFFIGTHVDEIVGKNAEEQKIADLKRAIKDKLNKANEECARYAGIADFDRYPYVNTFFDYSRFYCIDATNSEQVNRLLDKIFKNK